MSRRHYLLIPLGTIGDINPFLWMGRLLKANGHEVTLISCAALKQPVVNLPHFSGNSDPSEMDAVLNNPKFWDPWHGLRILFTFAAAQTERTFLSIRTCLRPDRKNIIVAPATTFGARLAREKLGLPLATVHLQPCAIPSTYETPQCGLKWMSRLHWTWKHFFPHFPTPIDYYVRPSIRRVCKAQQISSPNHIFNEWWHSPDGVLCLFPSWFANPQPDWPTPRVQTGFPLYDLDENIDLPSCLQNFLRSGSPPLLFTFGSMMRHAGKFYEIAAQVSTLLKRRAIFITPSDIPILPSTDIFIYKGYVPFSRFLPQVEAIVHHGGVGTISQALLAGVPQLVVPRSFDQLDNAARLIRLGAGRLLKPTEFTAKRVSDELSLLINNSRAVRSTCNYLAQRLSSESADHSTLNFLESIE